MTGARRRTRRGYSLIEMLLAISGIAILFGVSIGMIHMLLRLDRGQRARIGETTTVNRLARQFRQDAHAATEARPLAGKDREGIELVLPENHRVEYVEEGGRFARHEEAKGAQPRHEVYRMPSRGRAKFELRTADERRWATLVLEPKPNAKDVMPARPVVIEAWVGKDTRLARPGEVER